MNIQLHDALVLFGKAMIGRKVRGQVVDGVNLDIDTISQPKHPLRYILSVCFRENPPPPEYGPEQALLTRVFSEIPPFAQIVTHDVDELRARLVGLKPCHDHEWVLTDELAHGD